MKHATLALPGVWVPEVVLAVIAVAVLLEGSNSKKFEGAGNLHGGDGLPTHRTFPFGSSAAGASIGNMVWLMLPFLALSVGPTSHFPRSVGLGGGVYRAVAPVAPT